jgi:hypothetical protein
MKRASCWCVILFGVVLPVAAVGGPFEDAKAAYRRYDYETALKLWMPLAEAGHAESQFSLGDMYENGWGVPKDPSEAAKWYRRAAAQGEPHAQFSLGFMYRKGTGVPEDLVLAHMWLNVAASRLVKAWETRNYVVAAREEVAAKLGPEELARARRLAEEWTPKPE